MFRLPRRKDATTIEIAKKWLQMSRRADIDFKRDILNNPKHHYQVCEKHFGSWQLETFGMPGNLKKRAKYGEIPYANGVVPPSVRPRQRAAHAAATITLSDLQKGSVDSTNNSDGQEDESLEPCCSSSAGEFPTVATGEVGKVSLVIAICIGCEQK